MKTQFILVLCCSMLLSCYIQKEDKNPHSLLVEGISGEDPKDIFSLYSGIILFCKINNNEKLGYLTVDRMNNIFIHDSLYSKINYPDFVSNVINQKISFKLEYAEGYFVPDNQILLSYAKMSFPDFLIAYTDSIGINEYRIRSNLSFEEQFTTIYCLFQQGYYTSFDDMSGFYDSNKMDSLRKKSEDVLIEIVE